VDKRSPSKKLLPYLMLNGPKVHQGPAFRRFPISRCWEHGQQKIVGFGTMDCRRLSLYIFYFILFYFYFIFLIYGLWMIHGITQRISLSAIGGKVLKS
jgi:hypothetical protein